MSDRLEECPLCGTSYTSVYYGYKNGGGRWIVTCHSHADHDCYAEATGATREEAVKNWNQWSRAVPLVMDLLDFVRNAADGSSEAQELLSRVEVP